LVLATLGKASAAPSAAAPNNMTTARAGMVDTKGPRMIDG
jgi:hypothetical protein